jgi:hypothetical protein
VPGVEHQLRDLMVVDPVQTPLDSPVVSAVERAIGRVLDRQASKSQSGCHKPCRIAGSALHRYGGSSRHQLTIAGSTFVSTRRC